MTCHDVRDVADVFLSHKLPIETNREILQHLDTCASCRTEIDARRSLRRALLTAFDRAPELQPSAAFVQGLREQLREAARNDHRAGMFSRRWFAIAASVALITALASIMVLKRPTATSDALAQDAIGDHRNCALKFRLIRTPMPLEEAARRFDSAFRLLLTAPPDETSTPGGQAQVVDRHSCAYGNRRFGHVVLQYQGHVVSLLVTANEGTAGAVEAVDEVPHLIGRPMNGLSVVSVNGSRHAVLLVSDLGNAELTQLSQTVSLPLAQRLAGSFAPDRDTMASVYAVPSPQGSAWPRQAK